MKRLLVLVALLPACAAMRVETTATIFHGPGHEARGTIAVRAVREEVGQSLEFQAYRPRIERRLAAAGYTIAAGAPDYVALVGFGIDAGRPSLVSVPIYGQTSAGAAYAYGSVTGPGAYIAPTYGVIGTTSVGITLYTRSIALDIVDAGSLGGGAPRKRYEMRAWSTGQCGALVEVFDAMLEAMFAGFPGESGRARTLRVPVAAEC